MYERLVAADEWSFHLVVCGSTNVHNDLDLESVFHANCSTHVILSRDRIVEKQKHNLSKIEYTGVD